MKSLKEIMERVANGMDKEEANETLKLHVEECVALGDDKEEATKLFRLNIGYFAGYYDHAVADKAYELFDTEHPIFGKEHPSPEEIFRRGFQHGRRMRERSQLV